MRDPDSQEAEFNDMWGPYKTTDDRADVASLERLLIDRPSEMAELLFEYGFTLDGLCEELKLDYADKSFYMDVPNFSYY